MTTQTVDDEDLIGLPYCKKCGEQHESNNGGQSCAAHRRNGTPCHAYPVPGGTVCIRHGGRMQEQGRVVREARAQAEMEHATNMLGLVNYDISPEEALLQAVRESA